MNKKTGSAALLAENLVYNWRYKVKVLCYFNITFMTRRKTNEKAYRSGPGSGADSDIDRRTCDTSISAAFGCAVGASRPDV